MYWHSVFNLLAGLINFYIGYLVLSSNKDDEPSKSSFAIFMFSAGAWNISSFILTNIPSTDTELATLFGSIMLIFVATTMLMCLLFAIYLRFDETGYAKILVIIPAIIIIIMIIWESMTPAFHESTGWRLALGKEGSLTMLLGTIYVYVYYFLSLILLSSILWHLTNGVVKKKLLLIYFGIIVMGLISLPAYLLQSRIEGFPPLGGFAIFFGCILFYLGMKRDPEPKKDTVKEA